MFLVEWLPDPLSLSFSFLLCYSVIAHRPLTLSFSLLHSQPSPFLSSSSFFTVKLLARAHGSFFTGTVKLSLLSLGVCLGKNSPSWGGSRSGETSSDLVRQDLTGSDEISLDLAISLPIRWDLVRSSEILAGFWLDLAIFGHGTTISSNQRKPDRNRPTNPITDPPDPTSLIDGQRVLSLQTRLTNKLIHAQITVIWSALTLF